MKYTEALKKGVKEKMEISKTIKDVQNSIQDVQDSIQDEIASKAVRKSTLKSIKQKKKYRLRKLKADYEAEIRDINIQYSKNPERLKAKYAAAEYARSERARLRAERRIAAEERELEIMQNERILSTSEEIASSIVQGIGAALFIAATAILDTIGIRNGMDFKSLTIVCYTLFGVSMILMYLSSCLQHAFTAIVPKVVFNRLAHVFVFLNIGFAYTTYTITKIQGELGWIMFGIVWGLDLIGILFYAIAGKRHAKLNTVLYSLAAVSLFAMIKVLHDVLPGACFTMLLCAAGFYIAGFIFYNLKKVKFMHFVGNLLMLIASVYMFFSLFLINI